MFFSPSTASFYVHKEVRTGIVYYVYIHTTIYTTHIYEDESVVRRCVVLGVQVLVLVRRIHMYICTWEYVHMNAVYVNLSTVGCSRKMV
jgi:hypothetical protein